MDTRFKPKPGDYGTEVVTLVANVGTLSADTDTTVIIPKGYRKLFLRGAAFFCTTAPADADGAITAVVSKITASDGTAVAMTSALDLEGVTANRVSPFTVSGIGDSARIIQPGDGVKLVVTNDSAAITTQAAGAFVALDCLVLQ